MQAGAAVVSTGLDACAVHAFEQKAFAAPKGGAEVTVKYPLSFTPALPDAPSKGASPTPDANSKQAPASAGSK